MKPKSVLLTLAFMIIFSSVTFTLLSTLTLSWSSGADFNYVFRHYWWGGVIFGVLFGSIITVFIRTVTITLPFQSLSEFQARLQAALAEISYHFDSQSGNILSYSPGVRAGILGGRIHVQFGQDSAVIMGPWQHVRRLPKKMGYGTPSK